MNLEFFDTNLYLHLIFFKTSGSLPPSWLSKYFDVEYNCNLPPIITIGLELFKIYFFVVS